MSSILIVSYQYIIYLEQLTLGIFILGIPNKKEPNSFHFAIFCIGLPLLIISHIIVLFQVTLQAGNKMVLQTVLRRNWTIMHHKSISAKKTLQVIIT